MKQNLHNHIKSRKAKWTIVGIAIMLIIILLVGMCLQLFGQGKLKPSEWFKSDNTSTEVVNSSLSFDFDDTPQFLLSQSDTVAVSSDVGKYLEATLTATVLPEDATNKDVVWSIEWLKEQDEDISEYWQIINTNEANVIKIRLLHNASYAKVTVTTVDGGFSAYATVKHTRAVEQLVLKTATYERKYLNADGVAETVSGEFLSLGINSYQVPLYLCDDNNLSVSKYTVGCTYTMKFRVYDFFDDEIILTSEYGDMYKSIHYSSAKNQPDGSSTIYSRFDDNCYYNPYRPQDSYYYIRFSFRGYNSARLNSVKIDFENLSTKKKILNFIINFTIPVEAVGLSFSDVML